jgi:hypothetical protein
MADAWEYKIVSIDVTRWTKTGLPNDLNENFDKWGAEGWEPVGTEAIQTPSVWWYGSSTNSVLAFFKRRRTK